MKITTSPQEPAEQPQLPGIAPVTVVAETAAYSDHVDQLAVEAGHVSAVEVILVPRLLIDVDRNCNNPTADSDYMASNQRSHSTGN